MKFYITKYALTKGIIEAHGEITTTSPEMCIVTIQSGHRAYEDYFNVPDWHLMQEDAICRAEIMRDSKLKSLKKQIERLEDLKFYKD